MTGAHIQAVMEGLSVLAEKDLPPMMSVRVERITREVRELFAPWWAGLHPLIERYNPGRGYVPLDHPKRAAFEADPEVAEYMAMELELDGPPLAFEDLVEEGIRMKPRHLSAMIAGGVVAARKPYELPPEVVALFEDLSLGLYGREE